MYGALTLVFIISVIILGIIGVDPIVTFFVSLIISFFTAIGYLYSQSNTRISALSTSLYSKDTNTLTLFERSSKNAKVIKVEEMSDYNLTYHPSRIVYTGATVGGVHTGGFHETENYYSVDRRCTKKYHLTYNGAGVKPEDYCPIYIIKLSSSMVKEAKENPNVSKYLTEENTLVLTNKAKTNSPVNTALNQGKTDTALQMTKSDYYSRQLSKKHCDAIRNWICSYI